MRVQADDQKAQLDWLTRELRTHMRKLPKRHQLVAAARHAQALFEINAARLPCGHIACGAGCASCCNAHVGVEMAEAFVILEFLRETRKDDALADLLARTGDRAREVGGLDPAARWAARVPCGFLDRDSGNCTIYEARPLACRGYNSTERRACDEAAARGDSDAGIPADGERLGRSRLVRQALARATAAVLAAEPDDHVKLHSAVTAAANAGDALSWQRDRRKRKAR